MQLLLVRHALPLRSEAGQGSDPDLSDEGVEQAERLPAALARFPITRLVSSPQRRALQTGQPVADALGLQVEVDDRLAEYDRDMDRYVPIEEITPADMARLASGHLPSGVDEQAFAARVLAAGRDIVDAAEREETVVVFSHGGAINALVQHAVGAEKLLCVQIDYVSITRLLWSTQLSKFFVAGVNSVEHVWDLLPRNKQW